MKTTQKDWLDGQQFARVPKSALLDSRLGLRHFKLLCMLLLYVNKDGICWPGLDCIAECLGFYKKDGQPDKQLVSKLISWSHADKGPGLGLVQLGYVKKLGWIAGRETQSYQLQLPVLAPGDMNMPTNRRISNEEYKAKRKAKEEEKKSKADAEAQEFIDAMNSKYETEEALKNAARAAESESASSREGVQQQTVPVERVPGGKSVYVHGGEEYTGEEVSSAYFAGDWGDIPRPVVEHFGYSYNMAE